MYYDVTSYSGRVDYRTRLTKTIVKSEYVPFVIHISKAFCHSLCDTQLVFSLGVPTFTETVMSFLNFSQPTLSRVSEWRFMLGLVHLACGTASVDWGKTVNHASANKRTN